MKRLLKSGLFSCVRTPKGKLQNVTTKLQNVTTNDDIDIKREELSHGIGMRSVDKSFYNSKQWLDVRDSYLKSVGYLCEECKKEGRITPAQHVHHKIHLNKRNVHDPNIALSFTNLEAVCIDCHNRLHSGANPRRYIVDVDGNIIVKQNT